MKTKINSITDQGIAFLSEHFKDERIALKISEITKEYGQLLGAQDESLLKALMSIDEIREFLSDPSKILGSELTKHGEIAEHAEVGIRNARDILLGNDPVATFNGVGRLAPEDYLIGNDQVQSKFYNGINNTLKAVMEHNHKYDYFGTTEGSYYHIPKEQYEIINKLINGESVEGLTIRKIEGILNTVKEIEKQFGKPFSDVVKPSLTNYSDVQSGTIDGTLNNEAENLTKTNERIKDDLKKSEQDNKNKVPETTGPSFAEAAKIAGIAAAVGGGINFSLSIYSKIKHDKKNIADFTINDWKDIGISTGEGALKGGIRGGTVYAISNFSNTSAPLAGAYVSACFGMGSLVNQYRKGDISNEELIENCEVVCIDSAIAAIGSTLGQVIIPVPILGAVVGSIVLTTMSSIGKKYLNQKEQKLIREYDLKFNTKIKEMDRRYYKKLTNILSKYYNLGSITEMAFNLELNSDAMFKYSTILANEYNIPKEDVLTSLQEIDSFFLD